MYMSSYNVWSNSTIGSEDNKKEETNFNQRERERERRRRRTTTTKTLQNNLLFQA